jgi:hypothetical protein
MALRLPPEGHFSNSGQLQADNEREAVIPGMPAPRRGWSGTAFKAGSALGRVEVAGCEAGEIVHRGTELADFRIKVTAVAAGSIGKDGGGQLFGLVGGFL